MFIVPGIVKYYEYLMVPYILAENPNMNQKEVFQISKRMMMGQKWNTFVLDCSFIGWRILEGITLGIVNEACEAVGVSVNIPYSLILV